MKAPSLTILEGDCIEQLKTLPDESVHVCITSPPYWGLRDYGVDGQIGLEKTPEEYVEKMVTVFQEVRRVLRGDGTCWVNLGSSYASQGGSFDPQDWDNKQSTNRGSAEQVRNPPNGFKPKDMVPIPWMVAMAMQQDGWWLRQDIIWHKPNPMPESVTDRCTKAHEYIFLLSKSASYFYDAEAIKEPAIAGFNGSTFTEGKTALNGQREGLGMGPRNDNGTRNKRSVWTIPSQAFNGDVSYGKCRIASPDCSVHDYQADLVRARQYGEQLIASRFDHNPGNGAHPFEVQEGAFVAIPLHRCASLFDVSSAICRSNQTHRTAIGSAQDAIFYGISPDRTECIAQVRRLAAKFFRIHASRNGEDAFEGASGFDPLEQTGDHILGSLTFEKIPSSCSCHYAGTVEKRQDHFACFPEALVKPCILAGTSARGCCPKCGAPWERVVEQGDRIIVSERGNYGLEITKNKEQLKSLSSSAERMPPGKAYDYKTTGWTSTCDCGCTDTVPCTVLDPFGGSFTSCQVALELSRNAVGIELNPEYVKLARARCAVTPGLALA